MQSSDVGNTVVQTNIDNEVIIANCNYIFDHNYYFQVVLGAAIMSFKIIIGHYSGVTYLAFIIGSLEPMLFGSLG